MPSATFPIPAAELPLVEANLTKCPGIDLVGVVSFSSGGHAYYDLFISYGQESDLYQLGSCVGSDLEKLEGGSRG